MNCPVLALKDDRVLTRLIEQAVGYAKLIDQHADLFAELYGALLGHGVAFDGPTEKCIVWPQAGEPVDPRGAELRGLGNRVVGCIEDGAGGYAFRVGAAG